MTQTMHVIRLLWVAVLLSPLPSMQSQAASLLSSDENRLVEALIDSPATAIAENFQDKYSYSGLASYYNNLSCYIVHNSKLRRVDDGETIQLEQDQWLAVVGRFDVLLIQANRLSMKLDESSIAFDNAEILRQPDTVIKLLSKPELRLVAPELDQIRYTHLWGGFAWLAKVVEASLVAIQAYVTRSWGVAIIIFAVLLKLLLLPASIMTERLQHRVSLIEAQLAPQLAQIKAKYDGEAAHNRLMAAHKDLGVSPFYTLKPMLGTLIQIPILISVFNALGEMPQMLGQSLLWIDNLAYPDSIVQLPFPIPMLGDEVSLLPFIMTAVTIYSTILFENRHASAAEMKRKKRNLYLMAVVFLILFYPFPAAMVLYWVSTNFLHSIQQQLIKI